MTKATLEIPSEAAATAARASVLNSIAALFLMTLSRQALTRRMIVLSALYLLPIGLALLIRYNGAGFAGPHAGYQPLFAEFLVVFLLIPQTLIPFTSLVCSAGLIQDEVEEQTITYLLIRPLPRWSVFAAKLLATMVVTIGLAVAFTSLTYFVIGWGSTDYWVAARGRMLKTMTLFALSLAAYDALFAFVSLLMKRALLVGIAYIIVLEGVVANIDFVIRKFTVMFYFRVLCERWLGLSRLLPVPGGSNIDMLTAPGLGACVATLLAVVGVTILLSGVIMESREFRVKTPEGS